ncbi:hypothetical protein ANANG_G00036900 [Anguilla anguilla]|uniref:Uncharacterized protein n=1 Tax=Anguilla anguilla TaxID=7936 RepID=A0A9D3MSV9_ANGAN|nr:hypothetical protein ANANG_G00036900 [Anguilla anguilla]
MEEVGSARRGTEQKTGSFADANSDDEDDYYICPITGDPVSPSKEICDYLKNLIHNKQQLTAASPTQHSFQYKNAKETEPEQRSVSFGALTERGRQSKVYKC